MADLQSRGDGTFILRPRVAESDLDTWIPAKEAAKFIGVGRQEIYELLDPAEPFLVSRRPAKRKILVSLRSAREFRRATAHADFWEDAGRTIRNTHLAATRAALAVLTSTDH